MRMTTRRSDHLANNEVSLLAMAAKLPALWLEHGAAPTDTWQAMFALQRFGLVVPTIDAKPDMLGRGLGWRITARGRQALDEIIARALEAA